VLGVVSSIVARPMPDAPSVTKVTLPLSLIASQLTRAAIGAQFLAQPDPIKICTNAAGMDIRKL